MLNKGAMSDGNKVRDLIYLLKIIFYSHKYVNLILFLHLYKQIYKILLRAKNVL